MQNFAIFTGTSIFALRLALFGESGRLSGYSAVAMTLVEKYSAREHQQEKKER